jgi:hypothetical protein
MTTKLTNFEHIMMSEQQAENLSITGEKTFWRKKWRKKWRKNFLEKKVEKNLSCQNVNFSSKYSGKTIYRSWVAEKLNRILTIFSELN